MSPVFVQLSTDKRIKKQYSLFMHQICNNGSSEYVAVSFLPTYSDPQAGGPRPESGCVGFSGEWHRHPRDVPVLPHLLSARTIQQGPSQEGGPEQVGGERCRK